MAERYMNQREIGVAIKKCIEAGVVKREELVLVSKVNFLARFTVLAYQRQLTHGTVLCACVFGFLTKGVEH
jgi:hypothetical protein